jgi:hypothetical protein
MEQQAGHKHVGEFQQKHDGRLVAVPSMRWLGDPRSTRRKEKMRLICQKCGTINESCLDHGQGCGCKAPLLQVDESRRKEAITAAHHAVCTCGGAGPGEGCPACEMYHALYTPNAGGQR